MKITIQQFLLLKEANHHDELHIHSCKSLLKIKTVEYSDLRVVMLTMHVQSIFEFSIFSYLLSNHIDKFYQLLN